MQGHHLHAFGAFLLLLALEHVAHHQLADGVLDGHSPSSSFSRVFFSASIRNQTLLMR
jgi:hypothetical protein